MDKITKKLQSLVKSRKTPKVVLKQGSVKLSSRPSSSTSYVSDGYSEESE